MRSGSQEPVDRNAISATFPAIELGQARKSLWIEIEAREDSIREESGQARKSLWIEIAQ